MFEPIWMNFFFLALCGESAKRSPCLNIIYLWWDEKQFLDNGVVKKLWQKFWGGVAKHFLRWVAKNSGVEWQNYLRGSVSKIFWGGVAKYFWRWVTKICWGGVGSKNFRSEVAKEFTGCQFFLEGAVKIVLGWGWQKVWGSSKRIWVGV